MQDDFDVIAAELIEAGRALHALGMVPATSGNFSARLGNGNIAITVSGAHKGRLRPADIMSINDSGDSPDSRQPSAETGLHLQLYRQFPRIRAVLHPHSQSATLTAKLRATEIVLADYELLKAFEGISTHKTRLIIPVFENDQNIARLAGQVSDYIGYFDGKIFAYIIRGHGFYTWGESVSSALRHCEALEFLLQCELKSTGMTVDRG